MKNDTRPLFSGRAVLFSLAMLGMIIPRLAISAPFLVKDGKPQAEIIVAAQPTRSAKLAAAELQRFITRLSGATLIITNAPTGMFPVKLYVGRSPDTDRLKLTNDDLRYGAFRMVSGENWLAFLGRDDDYVPPEPWVRDPNDKAEVARVMAEWDRRSGGKWGNPLMSMHDRYSPLLDLWEGDERGSLNAVYRFVQDLGVRWYYPGEFGLIVPTVRDIPLPKVDTISRPDFPMRSPLIYYARFSWARPGIEPMADQIRWQLWLGFRSYHETVGFGTAHGSIVVIMRDEMKQAHPDYYALWNGKRATDHDGYGSPCLSSEGLFQENVKYVRAVLDVYHEPMVGVGPADSYALCGCELCKGKDTPGRGFGSDLSDYVWDYVNRVALEVAKTHPGRKIHCVSYPPYILPPEKIGTLSSNLVVGICQWRSLDYDPEHRRQSLKLRQDWLAKLPSKQLWIFDYYRHGAPGCFGATPAFFPRLIAEDLRSLKGISLGDYIEVYNSRESDGFDGMIINHLNAYVTARCLWDANTDVDALLEEYYDKFYGPARKPIKAFIEYAEANWMKADKDYKVIDRLFELIAPARKAAGDTIYGQRIARLAQYMERLKPLRERLAKGRDKAPEVRALGREAAAVVIDGKLDEAFWRELPQDYALQEVETGAAPQWGTAFKAAWSGDALYLGIVCRESDIRNLNITTRVPESAAIFDGDAVEVLLETETHAYYQFAVNPAGAMVDVDRRTGINTLWSARAQVACHIGDDFWSVEMRIPSAGATADNIDPLKGVSGTKPTALYPWYINVCRQRIRPRGRELSAFSPTGRPDFHEPMKFGVLVVP